MIKRPITLNEHGHRLNGLWLEPTEAAAAKRPALIFLHEGLGSIGQWRDFPSRLCQATGLRGLIYERWGHGGSDALTEPRGVDYLHREALQALPEVLTQSEVQRAIVIGHSDGGSIGLLFAAAYPHWCRGLITLAAHAFVEPITRAGIIQAGEAFRSGDLATGLRRYHGEGLDLLFWGWHDRWLSREFAPWNIENELATILCPTLVAQGEGDEYGSLEQVYRIANAIGPQAQTWVIPHCGHHPHRQAKEACLAKLAGFIAGLSGDSPALSAAPLT